MPQTVFNATTGVCILDGGFGRCLASVSAVDFGHDGEPWADGYHRVIEAELAAEVWAEDQQRTGVAK